MTAKKPIVNKGYVIYKDYEFLFNFLNDEELGKVIRLLNSSFENPELNPSDNNNVNNVYNYIANRIIDYTEKREFYSKSGKQGGNPTLKGTVKSGDKLKEKKIKEDKIKEEIQDSLQLNMNFATFWNDYPNKVDRGSALEAFKVLTAKEANEVLKTVQSKDYKSWVKEQDKSFIQKPHNWLKAQGWLNDYKTESKDSKSNNIPRLY